MEKKNTCSRRSFLKGIAAGTVTLAATSVFGGCSSDKPTKASTDEVKTSAASTEAVTEESTASETAASEPVYSWQTPPEPVDDAAISETLETDIAVIGAGVAGMSAARAAAEAGKKVIVVEKADHVVCRGNFGCQIGCVDSFYQKEKGIVVDKDYLLNRFTLDTLGMCNSYFVKYWIDHSAETLDWILQAAKSYVVDAEDLSALEDGVISVSGKDYGNQSDKDLRYPQFNTSLTLKCNNTELNAGGFNPLLEAFAGIVEEAGGALLFSTFARQLVKSGNAVTGVICEKQDGTLIRINAAQVILATGDFSNNTEMSQYFIPQANGLIRLYNSVDCDGNACNTGDGHIMAMWAGAHMECGPYAPMAHLSQVNDVLLVNCYGERVCNEDLGAQTITNVVLHQPGRKIYAISGDARGTVKLDPGPFSALNEETYGENDMEKLATYIGETCDPAILKKTIDDYNAACAAGKDEEFSKDPRYLVPLDYPIHANESGPGALLVVMGGIDCDRNCQALDDAYAPIPGLFVVGNVQGGRFGAEYPMTAPGISHGIAFTLGKKVGSYVASL